MSKMNFSWLGTAVKSTLTFGKKNAPTLMTGGGILLGWAAVYVFWKESKNAEKAIQHQEELLKEQTENEDAELTKKEKLIVYAQYCWPSMAMGLGSTGLTVWAHKMDLSRLMEMYMITQFLEGKNDDQAKLIEKLKGEVPEKKVKEIQNELFDEKFPESEVGTGDIELTGNGSTLFEIDVGNIKFRSSITDVQRGLYEFKSLLKDKRDKEVKKELGGAFFASDNPFPDMSIYASEDFDTFLEILGLKKKYNLGDILEFRDYGSKEFLPVNYVMDYKDHIDPETGIPAVCRLRIKEFLSPSYELMERNPL